MGAQITSATLTPVIGMIKVRPPAVTVFVCRGALIVTVSELTHLKGQSQGIKP